MKYFIIYLVLCLVMTFQIGAILGKKQIKSYFWFYVFIFVSPIEAVLIVTNKDREPSKMGKYIVDRTFNW